MRKWFLIPAGTAFLAITAWGATAGKPETPLPSYVVSIETVKQAIKEVTPREFAYGVTVYVTVADVNGRGAAGLTPADFKVADEGVPIADLKTEAAPGERVPTAAVILVDISSSMLDAVKLERAKATASRFVTGAAPDDQLLIMTFYERVTPLGGFTNDKTALNTELRGIETASDRATRFYDALDLATQQLEQKSPKEFPRRVVLALTDADDSAFRGSTRGSVRIREESIIDAKQAGIGVYAVAFGPGADVKTLEIFAEKTGGLVCDAEKDDPLAFVEGIWAGRGGQYRLSYALASDKLAGVTKGQKRNLAVTLTRAAAPVTASKPYTVNEWPPREKGGSRWGLYALGAVGVVALLIVIWIAVGGRKRRRRSVNPLEQGPILAPEPPAVSSGKVDSGSDSPTARSALGSTGPFGGTATELAEETRSATGGWFDPAAVVEGGWGALVVTRGPADEGKRFALNKDVVTIGLGGVGNDGREIAVDIRLADPKKSRVVSRLHMIVKRTQGRVRIEDQSTNGTFIWRPQERVWERFGEAEVVPGDYICLGNDRGYFLQFEGAGGRATGRGDETVIAR